GQQLVRVAADTPSWLARIPRPAAPRRSRLCDYCSRDVCEAAPGGSHSCCPIDGPLGDLRCRRNWGPYLMGAFDHVLVLLSFVFALALTHLLSRVGGLVVARKRVRFSPLLALAIVNAVAFVFENWLMLWTVRGW